MLANRHRIGEKCRAKQTVLLVKSGWIISFFHLFAGIWRPRSFVGRKGFGPLEEAGEEVILSLDSCEKGEIRDRFEIVKTTRQGRKANASKTTPVRKGIYYIVSTSLIDGESGYEGKSRFENV